MCNCRVNASGKHYHRGLFYDFLIEQNDKGINSTFKLYY